MSEEVAIKVDGLYKDFALPHEKANSLKSTFLQKVRGGRRSVERQHALKDISFEVKKGEFFGIVGRNGSGKSTLLKIIAQIYKPTKGTVGINGRLVPFIELGVGFNPELTGRDNVYLSASLMGFSRKDIDRMYKDIVDFAELEKFMDQKLKNYSSGMQVRLAFSIATRVDTDILLIDEVLAVGDADFQRKCYDYFRNLKKLKKTVVFVSHDMNAVREYCDRAILIEQSELVSSGDSSEVSMDYTRMFVSEAENSKNLHKSDRWGDGTAKYIRATASKDVLHDSDESFFINLVAKASRPLDTPIFGFVIKDASGKEVLGINNAIKRKSVARIESGGEISIEWKVPNVFSDGSHTIDLAISDHDGTVVSDYWSSGLTFRVVKEEQTPYSISPKVGLKISKGS